MAEQSTRIGFGIALEGAGWHPAAWREPSSRPHDLFTRSYWQDLVTSATRAHADFVTIEDTLALQSSDRLRGDRRTDEVRGRLDALALAASIAPASEHIGIVPVVTATFTEPFNVSTGVATLDFVSHGRAGVQVRLSFRDEEIHQTGPTYVEPVDTLDALLGDGLAERLFDEGADVVDAVRRLWDSWEDDAEIRDAATDRFLDPDRLHTIDFVSERFSIRGPSITPRPPQGQPVVASLAHGPIPNTLAALQGDVVFVTPSADDAAEVLAQVRDAERAVERQGTPLRVYADLIVLLDETGGEAAADRLARLDALGRPLESDARVIAGSAALIADAISELVEVGYEGIRLRPGVLTDDLPRIAGDLAPELASRALIRGSYPQGATLRELLGLPAAGPSRYAGERGRISPAPVSTH